MASGVTVHDDVKGFFTKMKVINRDDDEKKRPRFALFTIKDGKIIIENSIEEGDLEKVKDQFSHFKSTLPKEHCCYALYDCHYETTESKKEDLVFFMWAPESAAIKEKMYYASSKGSLTKVFTGVKQINQINDLEDCCLETFAELFGKNTVSIEGCSLRCSHKKGH